MPRKHGGDGALEGVAGCSGAGALPLLAPLPLLEHAFIPLPNRAGRRGVLILRLLYHTFDTMKFT